MEEMLLELLREDPDRGMRALRELHEDAVRFAVAQHLNNPSDIQECVQDTFADFYLNFTRFDPAKGTLRSYLSAIASRKAIRRWKENKRLQLEAPPPPPSRPEEEWEQRQDLLEAMERLPSIDRKILLLKFYGNYTGKEISALLGIEYENVKKRSQRALKKLTKLMKEG